MERMQKYEVLRMIERDGSCHISLDCVEGTLLIYRVQRGDVLDKCIVLDWIWQLARQMELYHRSGPGRYYRYLNPYSVLVTRDERVMLLDMEAESNEFVIRNLQKRAMRNHFVKPILQIRENTKMAADLYSLGKTIQFTLACTEIYPSLTLFEEYRLSKVIQKCLGANPKNRYENLKQLLKDIPKNKKQNMKKGFNKKIVIGTGVCGAVLIGIIIFQMWTNRDAGEAQGDLLAAESIQEVDGVNVAEENETGAIDSSLEIEVLRQAFLENTKEGNEQVIRDGELLKSELLYYLALAYDREAQVEEAIQTYELLCESQCDDTVLEQAFYRKAILEQENGQLEQAKATCSTGLEAFPESEKLTELWSEMEADIDAEKSEDGTSEETGAEGETADAAQEQSEITMP